VVEAVVDAVVLAVVEAVVDAVVPDVVEAVVDPPVLVPLEPWVPVLAVEPESVPPAPELLALELEASPVLDDDDAALDAELPELPELEAALLPSVPPLPLPLPPLAPPGKAQAPLRQVWPAPQAMQVLPATPQWVAASGWQRLLASQQPAQVAGPQALSPQPVRATATRPNPARIEASFDDIHVLQVRKRLENACHTGEVKGSIAPPQGTRGRATWPRRPCGALRRRR
jgi:hypothetical protein